MPCADVLPINGYASINTYIASKRGQGRRKGGHSGVLPEIGLHTPTHMQNEGDRGSRPPAKNLQHEQIVKIIEKKKRKKILEIVRQKQQHQLKLSQKKERDGWHVSYREREATIPKKERKTN